MNIETSKLWSEFALPVDTSQLAQLDAWSGRAALWYLCVWGSTSALKLPSQTIFAVFGMQVPTIALSYLTHLGATEGFSIFSEEIERGQNTLGEWVVPAPGSNITVRGTINDVIETQVVGNDLIENLNVRLIQDGIGIQSGDSVSSSTPFSIIFLSPINGTATLSMLNADQTLMGLETIEVSVGRYANFEENELPSGRILSLRLSLAGENISLTYDLTYSTDD